MYANLPRHHDAVLDWEDVLFAVRLQGSFLEVAADLRSVGSRLVAGGMAVRLGSVALLSPVAAGRCHDVDDLDDNRAKGRDAASDEDDPHLDPVLLVRGISTDGKDLAYIAHMAKGASW